MKDLFAFLLGFRKFVIMTLFLLVMIAFRIFDLINGEQFATNLQVAIVAFFGTNVGEHLINLGKDYLNGKLKDLTKAANDTKDV